MLAIIELIRKQIQINLIKRRLDRNGLRRNCNDDADNISFIGFL
jgi:hypothetical protein